MFVDICNIYYLLMCYIKWKKLIIYNNSNNEYNELQCLVYFI